MAKKKRKAKRRRTPTPPRVHIDVKAELVETVVETPARALSGARD